MLWINKSNSMQEAATMANIAIHSKLYIDGWGLYHTLNRLLTWYYADLCIALAYVSDNPSPIGVAVRTGTRCQVYVQVSHAREGIGKRLVQEVVEGYALKDCCWAEEGEEGTSMFWAKCGVECR